MSEAQADRTVGAGGFWALPQTRLGWITVVIGAFVVVWMALLPMFQSLLPEIGLVRFSGGGELITTAVVFGVAGVAAGLHAIVRQGERSALVFLVVVPMMLLTLFWVLFFVGEIISPDTPGEGNVP